MENMSIGVVVAIALVVAVALLFIVNVIRTRAAANELEPARGHGAGAPPVQASAVTPQAHSQSAFDAYIADHTPDQLDDIPVYALAHMVTASFSSPSRVKWLEAVVAAAVPRGADPELLHTADYFWDKHEKWLFSDAPIADFCTEYLIAKKDEWSSSVHERIVLTGFAALASRDRSGTADKASRAHTVFTFTNGLTSVCDAYFGADAQTVCARIMAEAETLAARIRADLAAASPPA
ncbi:hypothetical protein [Hyphomonas johnsonii]|uniref:Uncharacterized protein n=1 Tax=Hyphomonas johnsonii MHS-2 TaxID=1280950 RepID=A0A059FFY1_9PROT|nr:hypothetical protein [Hyphomonas johnsonii]KCZ89433.1 hypothetical protein HJO_14482 [Hyphomonas johnsonii MHS-2]